jgi:deazaflavin-dependent oxidoreductase (nitroreductase family)
MRKLLVMLAASAALGVVLVGTATTWRRHPRIGTRFVNTVVNPVLVRRGLVGTGGSEIGTLEHVGRRTGVRRLTPVHPEAMPAGFRVMVPLGTQSEWARNVMAAGQCRLTVHGRTFDLDEPRMVDAADAHDLPWVVRRTMAALGFRYLYLRTFTSDADPNDVAQALVSEAAPIGGPALGAR